MNRWVYQPSYEDEFSPFTPTVVFSSEELAREFIRKWMVAHPWCNVLCWEIHAILLDYYEA